MIKTQLSSAPDEKPITLEQVKEHLRIPHDYIDEDQVLSMKIDAAVDRFETDTWRKLITQTWKAFPDTWDSEIEIPFGQLQSIESVKYIDADGVEQTVDPADYSEDTIADPGRLVFEDTFTLPELKGVNPIRIEFICGFGVDHSSIPPAIRDALLHIVADLYGMRETPDVEPPPNFFVESVIQNYKLWET